MSYFTVNEPECTHNFTIYNDNILPRCPSELGLILAPYLKGAYGLIAVILLLNLLIAMFRYVNTAVIIATCSVNDMLTYIYYAFS